MNATVKKCKECGTLFIIYPHEVYDGDPNYCRACNAEAKRNSKGKWEAWKQ